MHVQSVRDSLPATHNCIYVNTGHSCPPPLSVLYSVWAAMEQEASLGSGSAKALAWAEEINAHARDIIADFLGAGPEDIQITHSTREGISIVLYGISWRPGDELVISNLEHASLLIPAEVLARRRGVKVVQSDFNSQMGAAAILQNIELSLNSNTRLIALSHIQYGCGLRIPIREIATMARARGIPLFVDGAQSAGQIAVNVKDLDCDFYALSGQKWLMGPVGTGALYVRPESRAALEPLFTTNEIEARRQGRHPPLSRFALTSQNIGLVAGLAEAVRLNREIEVDRIEARSMRLAALLREHLKSLPIEIISAVAPSSSSGIVTVRVGDWPSGALAEELQTRFDIVARTVKVPEGVRFCTAYFNTEEEIKQIALALRTLIADGYSKI